MTFVLLAIKLTSDILQGSNIYIFQEHYTQIACLSVALAWNRNHFVLRKGHTFETQIKKNGLLVYYFFKSDGWY